MVSASALIGTSAALQRFDGADQRGEHGAHQFLKQALLVAEVEIDGALGDAGALGHVVEAGRLEAAGGEFIERGGEDRFAAGGAALFAVGRARRRRGMVLQAGGAPPARRLAEGTRMRGRHARSQNMTDWSVTT